MARLLSSTLIVFEGCVGYDDDSSLSYYVWCHCWYRATWIKFQFSFSYRNWDVWLKSKLLCTVFFWIYPCTSYCLSKSWWYNQCFLGVPWTLWIHMQIMYALVSMIKTVQKKIYHHHFLFLAPNIIVPGLIRYENTSHFIIAFFGAVHAYESRF